MKLIARFDIIKLGDEETEGKMGDYDAKVNENISYLVGLVAN